MLIRAALWTLCRNDASTEERGDNTSRQARGWVTASGGFVKSGLGSMVVDSMLVTLLVTVWSSFDRNIAEGGRSRHSRINDFSTALQVLLSPCDPWSEFDKFLPSFGIEEAHASTATCREFTYWYVYCIYINATTTTIAATAVDNYNHNCSNDTNNNPMESKILTDLQIVSSRQVHLSCSLSIILNQLVGIFQIVQCAGPNLFTTVLRSCWIVYFMIHLHFAWGPISLTDLPRSQNHANTHTTFCLVLSIQGWIK